MSLAALTSAISIASLLALGFNYYKYTTYDPEVRASDATNVSIFIYIVYNTNLKLNLIYSIF